ncbi:MAG TPA: SRPBCC family protein [Candidatus Angelobacter sp.]|nr:SRPBCC family protein [Candidatus Angelobacter sp.]
MTSHEHSVVVERPLMTVYDQWTQFESYPAFMDNVAEVEQVDDAMTHWKVSVAGVEREYDAQILEQRPGEVIAWQSVSGPRQAGSVRFAPLDPDRTRVTLTMDFEPQGFTENVGEGVGAVGSSVADSLERFKEYIEDRGYAEGGWRGHIADGEPVQNGGTRAMSDTPIDLRGDDVDASPFGEPGGGRGLV